MYFFKSVLSDDSDPPESEIPSNEGDPNRQSSPTKHRSELSPNPNADSTGGDDGWNLGGFMRTLSTKSESIIETYRRDLKEFGSGLKKEIEVAQGSLDQFGNSVVKGTAQIISQGKDAILTASLELNSDNNNNNQKYNSEKSLNLKVYRRFDSQVHAIQADASTYCDEPEDLEDYNNWKLDFSLEGKNDKIECLLKENDAMASIYKRVVPSCVDNETFWYRYYYKIHRFKKAEDVRARLVKQMSREEEELSWDVEDDDDREYESKAKTDLLTNNIEDLGKRLGSSGEVDVEDDVMKRMEVVHETNMSIERSKVEDSQVVHETDGKSKKSEQEAGGDKALNLGPDEKVMIEGKADDGKSSNNDSPPVASEPLTAKFNEKVMTESKSDDGKSSIKDNDSSLVANQQQSVPEEEDLGWDEIEDLSSIGEKKSSARDIQNNVHLGKPLATAEEEDLSWDIEDDDDDDDDVDGHSKPKA